MTRMTTEEYVKALATWRDDKAIRDLADTLGPENSSNIGSVADRELAEEVGDWYGVTDADRPDPAP